MHCAQHGMFIPGLGIRRYLAHGKALLAVLNKILPRSDPELQTHIAGVNGGSGNGYDLLWLMCLTIIPIFDQSAPPLQILPGQTTVTMMLFSAGLVVLRFMVPCQKSVLRLQ